MRAMADAEGVDPLAQGYRLHSRSTAEVVERVENVLSRLNRRGLKFRGRKTKLEPFINVLVMRFLALPADQQEAMMARDIPAFEAFLALPPERRGELVARPETLAGEAVEFSMTDPPPGPPKRRRRPG
jgi:hypothetical protein